MLNTNAPASFGYYSSYLNQPAVRKMLHVGSRKFPSNPGQCEMHLLSDFMVSFEDALTLLLSNVRVLLYSGQVRSHSLPFDSIRFVSIRFVSIQSD